MLLYLGSFQIVPVLAILLTVVAGALVASVAALALGLAFSTPEATFGAVLLAATALLIGAEVVARRLALRRAPRWTISLATLARTRRVGADRVGAKARRLADLLILDLPTPPGLVLTRELCARLTRLAPTTDARALLEALPVTVRWSLPRAVRRLGTDRVVVRSSFPGEDDQALHAGVFLSVRDVAADDTVALLDAVGRVLASARGPTADAYRRRHELAASAEAAVLIHAQVPDSMLGLFGSRAPDGRGDRLPLELCDEDGKATGWLYDMVDQALIPMAGGDARPAPGWVIGLAGQALALDHRLGGPVQIEFALRGELPWLLQVRRLPPLPERVTWINSGPVELDRDRVSDLLDTARGGAAAMAEALGEGLRAAGLNATVHADEVRRFDGVAYLNVAAWRRVQAVALATRGARAAWRQIRLLLCPPAADEPDDGPGEPAPRSLIHAEARLLMALAFTRASMDRLRSDPAPLARWLRSHLERRWRRLAAARDRVRLDLTRAEAGLVGLCAEDDGAVQPPVAPTRRFEPELPTAPEPVAGLVAGAVLVGVPFSSGIVVGHLASRPEARVARPRVLVLPHGGPQFVDAALAGDAVVLASGGVLSHVAVDVLEAGLPGLVCTDPRLARLPDGTRVRVDANCGSLEILEVPT